MRTYKIIVACGSGMATSHFIMEQLKDMFRKDGFSVDVYATKVSDLGTNHLLRVRRLTIIDEPLIISPSIMGGSTWATSSCHLWACSWKNSPLFSVL